MNTLLREQGGSCCCLRVLCSTLCPLKWEGKWKELEKLSCWVGGRGRAKSHSFSFTAKHKTVSLSFTVGNEHPPTQTNTILRNITCTLREERGKAQTKPRAVLLWLWQITRPWQQDTERRCELRPWQSAKRQIYSLKMSLSYLYNLVLLWNWEAGERKKKVVRVSQVLALVWIIRSGGGGGSSVRCFFRSSFGCLS